MLKTKRTFQTTAVLDSRFNKGLVNSQLRGLFDYEKETQSFDDCNKIFHAWSMTHVVPEKRPRFYNVQEVLKLPHPLYILVSSFSSMSHEGRDYVVIHMKTGNWIRFGLPLNKKLIGMLGGEELLARLLLVNGVHGLINFIEKSVDKVDNYEDKDNLKINVNLLKEIAKGMLLEGMTNVSTDE